MIVSQNLAVDSLHGANHENDYLSMRVTSTGRRRSTICLDTWSEFSIGLVHNHNFKKTYLHVSLHSKRCDVLRTGMGECTFYRTWDKGVLFSEEHYKNGLEFLLYFLSLIPLPRNFLNYYLDLVFYLKLLVQLLYSKYILYSQFLFFQSG